MKKLVSAILAFGVAISAAPSAGAHASYTDSNPKARSVVTKLPKLIWVEFDGNLLNIADKQTNFLSVKNSKGKEISDGKAYVGGARLTVKIKDQKATGLIKVSWRVVSEDGHPVSSSLTFTVRK